MLGQDHPYQGAAKEQMSTLLKDSSGSLMNPADQVIFITDQKNEPSNIPISYFLTSKFSPQMFRYFEQYPLTRQVLLKFTSFKLFFSYLLAAHRAYVAHRAATKSFQPCPSLASFSIALQL